MDIDNTKLIPPNCIGPKCVYKTRVYSATAYALKLAAQRHLTVDKLRRITKIDKKLAKSLPLTVRRLIIAIMDYIDGDPAIPVDMVMSKYPKEARDYIKKVIARIVENPLKYIEENQVNPPVGWQVIESPETLDPMLVPKMWFWYMVEFLSSVEANFRPELVFCGPRECYPAPLGLYPHRAFVGLAHDTGMIAPLYERIQEKYGAITAVEFIENLDVKKVALVVQPKKTITKAVFFLLVDNPRETAKTFAEFQAEASAFEEDMLKKVLNVGYEKLEIDDFRIREAVYETLKDFIDEE